MSCSLQLEKKTQKSLKFSIQFGNMDCPLVRLSIDFDFFLRRCSRIVAYYYAQNQKEHPATILERWSQWYTFADKDAKEPSMLIYLLHNEIFTIRQQCQISIVQF